MTTSGWKVLCIRFKLCRHAWSPLVVVLLISVCGGIGIDDAAANAQPAVAAPLPLPTGLSAPTSADASTTAVANEFSCGLSPHGANQAEVLRKINALRTAGAVCGSTTYPPVGAQNLNVALLKAHFAEMAANNYFARTGYNDRSEAQRVTDAGYSYQAMVENITAGQTGLQNMITGWTTTKNTAARP